MDDIIIKYLNKNYKMTANDYCHGRVSDVFSSNHILVSELSNIIEIIFSIGITNTRKIVNKWWDDQEIPYILGEIFLTTREGESFKTHMPNIDF